MEHFYFVLSEEEICPGDHVLETWIIGFYHTYELAMERAMKYLENKCETSIKIYERNDDLLTIIKFGGERSNNRIIVQKSHIE